MTWNKKLYANGKLIETREIAPDGATWIVRDAGGTETGREPLTPEELADLTAQGQPTPDEKLVADISAAPDLDAVKSALVKRFSESD